MPGSALLAVGFRGEVCPQDLGCPVRAADLAYELAKLDRNDGCNWGSAVEQEDRPAQQTDACEHFGDVGACRRYDHVLLDVHVPNFTQPKSCTSSRLVHKMCGSRQTPWPTHPHDFLELMPQ